MQVDLEKLEWIKKNQHVCISPWTKAELMIGYKTAIVQPCCNFQPQKDYEPFSTEPIENTKAAMMAGNLPKECWRCKYEESKGLQSERVRYLVQYSLDELKQFEQTRQLPVFYLGSKFSNLCNLACRSCDEYNSSLWSKVYDVSSTIELETDITDMPEYWQYFSNICKEQLENKGNKHVTFHPKGGETMVQPGFRRVLEWFIEQGYNKKLDGIIITTNFTSLQKRVLELLDQFNFVLFDGSIDSVGKNYHYVRWPEHFSTIEKNLETMSKLFDKKDSNGISKYRMMVTVTWSLNNIWYINDILNFWHSWMIKNNIQTMDMQCINLFRPSHLSVDILPEPYRTNLMSIIQSTFDHPIFNDNQRIVLKNYLHQLYEALQNQNLINEKEFTNYLKKTADGDLRNNVRMKDYNLLYDMLIDEHKNILESCYKVI